MSGKELILYILLNDLEDEPIDKDGVLTGFITIEEAACKRGVGVATVEAWISTGSIHAVKINGLTMVPARAFDSF